MCKTKSMLYIQKWLLFQDSKSKVCDGDVEMLLNKLLIPWSSYGRLEEVVCLVAVAPPAQ